MDKCSLRVKRIAATFSRKIVSGEPHESALAFLYSGISTENTTAIAEIIFATAVLPTSLHRGIAQNSGSSQQLTDYLKANNASLDRSKVSLLQAIPGFDNIAEAAKTIEDVAQLSKAQVEVEEIKNVVNIDTKYVEKEGAQPDIELLKRTTVKLDNVGLEMAANKQKRIEKNKGLSASSSSNWTNFLGVYFSTSTSYGAEFTKWVKDIIFDDIISHREEDAGFMIDASLTMNLIKEKINNKKDYYKTIPYDDRPYSEQFKNESTRLKYFHEVLSADFDFIINTIIPLISVSPKETILYNSKLIGLTDAVSGEFGEVSEFDNMSLNLDEIRHSLVKVPKTNNEYAVAEGVSRVLNTNPLDSAAFEADATLERNAFHYNVNDETVWFRDANGLNYDVTPISRYTYSYESKRNADYIDHYVNPLDQGTKFINGLFPMMRYVEIHGNDLIYGDRMKPADFLSISPYLLTAGRTIEDLRSKLLDMYQEKGKHYKIAQSLLVHIFNPYSTNIGGNDIYSIAHAINNNLDPTSINADIRNALYSALVSKELTRRMMVVEGKVTISKPLGETSDAILVDNNVASEIIGYGRYTNAFISRHLVVKGEDVMIIRTVGDVNGSMLSNIGDMTSMQNVMGTLNLGTFFNKISDVYTKRFGPDIAENKILRIAKDIITIAAANKRTKNPLERLSIEKVKSSFDSANFHFISPSTIVSGSRLQEFAEVFHPETIKNITVAGEKVNPTATPNRDAFIPNQIDSYKMYNIRVNKNKISFIPYLLDNDPTDDSRIYKATHHGTFIKTPTTKNGKVIKVSNWNMRARLEHAMIYGFLDGPKKDAGKTFYLQPINYSDKSAIEMHEIRVSRNLLKASNEELTKAYVEYNIKKNEQLQQISIDALTEFIGGSYNYVRNRMIREGATSKQTDSLVELRDMLVNKTYPKEGDMTKPINMLLNKVKLKGSIIENSDSNLDKDADYIYFSGEDVYLKPHLGVRAEAFRNNGIEITKKHLEVAKAELKHYKVSDDVIKEKLKSNDITKNLIVDNFYDKFFLINGIYGHSLKVITMGDESYFKSYYDAKNITAYYKAIDSGERTGLEETSGMLLTQFKRAQSELTRGVLYAQKETIVGLRRSRRKNNVLSHLDIFTKIENGEIKEKFVFKKLAGKTLEELHALDILVPFEDGSLISLVDTEPLKVFVNLRVGNSIITISNTYDDPITSIVEDAGLYESLKDLINEAIEADSKVTYTVIPAEESSRVNDSLDNITLKEIRDLKKTDNLVVMPDYIPNITVSDPISSITLLNSSTTEQDNSDAIQFMHPLFALIMDLARGGKFGAFHTENNEAQKTMSLTFEYDRFRQILQKKSVQNPFTYEQMKKFGSMELFNMLKKLNSAIPFTQQNMEITEYIDGEKVTTLENFENLQALVDYFGGIHSGDQVWAKVLNALKENPVNLYSFVGLITVPTNQKTGHKKINKWDEMFSNAQTEGNIEPVIDYVGNEYNFEILTKAHEYDVTANRGRSTISLLSQLVNATGFGGLSNVPNNILQNSMQGVMEINRLRSSGDLADIAIEMMEDARSAGKSFSNFKDVIKNLRAGNPSINGYNDSQIKIYRDVLRKGVDDMAQLSFNEELDSALIKEIIEDPNFSLDTPAIMSKVIGTIRSALFKDTVKMKMNGFIGTVSATHKTINVYTLPGRVRVGRQGFITGALRHGLRERVGSKKGQSVEGRVAYLHESNIEDIKKWALPFDDVMVNGHIKLAGDVDFKAELSNKSIVKVVFTPDVLYNANVDSIEKFDAMDSNLLLNVLIDGKKKSVFKWYYEENTDPITIQEQIAEGLVVEDVTERYSLRWYQIDSKGEDLKNSKAYRDFYRVNKKSNPTEQEIKDKTALLIIETRKKNPDGTSFYKVTSPEVVLPTFLSEAYNLPKGESLSNIIGTDGNSLYNATNYFRDKIDYRRFKKEDTRREFTKAELIGKYTAKYAFTGEGYVRTILTILEGIDTDIVTISQVREINKVIEATRKDHLEKVSQDFITALNVVLTRIPGQAKQSGFTGRVIDFLDAQGNATHAPTDHLTNTGGDLDIDTLSVLTKAVDFTGRIFKYTEYLNDYGLDKDKIISSYNKEIKEAESVFKDLINAHNKLVQKRLDSLDTIEDAETIEKIKKRYIDDEKIKDIIKSQRAKITKKFENLLFNATADGIYDSLNNVNTMVELNTPISMGNVRDIITKIPKQTFSPAIHGESFMPIFVYEDENAQGKEGIGVFATVSKINSAVQTSKAYFDNIYLNEKMVVKNPFVFNISVEYKDTMTDKNVKYVQTGFSDLDRFEIARLATNNQDIQSAIRKVIEGEEIQEETAKLLSDILIAEVDYVLNNSTEIKKKEDINDIIISKANSLFNIKLKTKNPLKELVRLFKKKENLSKAFVEIIGKKLSDDIQSQFLSAATDNARVLLLGKIRSNSVTNSVITAMMLLNFEATSIIKFLFDPQIEMVLNYYDKKKGNLEPVRIVSSDLDSKIIPGINKSSKSIKSLAKILAVSDEIAKFRGVRSLNENFKIDANELDKILEDLDSDTLYSAIINDNINSIKPLNDAQKVFNPNMMVFLHPQSRSLFKILYEAEMNKIPALFKTSKVLEGFLKKHRNMPSYKNTINHLSGALVENYFITPKKGKIITGDIAIKQPSGYKLKPIDLDNDNGRKEFVENFRDYVKYADLQITRLGGRSNAAVQYFGWSMPYGTSTLVLNIPVLKHLNADPVDISIIHRGIEELATVTGNKELDSIQQKLYKNLSLYALITSSGQVKKGSMIELFSEINKELAAHIKTLSSADFKNMLPTSDQVKSMLIDDIAIDTNLKSDYKKNKKQEEEGIDQGESTEYVDGDPNEKGYTGEDEEGMHPEREEFNQYEKFTINLKDVVKVQETKKWTANKIYISPTSNIEDAIFLGTKDEKIAYRIFKRERVTLPINSTNPPIKITNVSDEIIRDLSLIGSQVGMTSTFEGKEIRILAYSGTEVKNNIPYHNYIITGDNFGERVVAGPLLMEENEDILLYGNIIQERSSFNNKIYDQEIGNIKAALEVVPKKAQTVDPKMFRGEEIAKIFTPKEIRTDDIINKETLFINSSLGGAREVLKIKTIGALASTSYAKYHKSDLPEAIKGSRRILIPAFKTENEINTKTDAIYDIRQKEIEEMQSVIVRNINDIKFGEDPIVFYGLKQEGLEGGAKVFETALRGSKGFKVAMEESKDVPNMFKYTVYKRNNKAALIPVNGIIASAEITGKRSIKVISEFDTNESIIKTQNLQIALKALSMGLLDIPYKSVKLKLGENKLSSIVVNAGQSNQRIYVIVEDRGFNDKYYRVIKESSMRGDQSKFSDEESISSTRELYVSSEMLKQFNSIISEDNSEIINKAC